jgi:hypothetical protein
MRTEDEFTVCQCCGAKAPEGMAFSTGICRDCDDEVCIDDIDPPLTPNEFYRR